jgi:hypothetical protein
MIAVEIGSTNSFKVGETTFSPSTADRTEMAGVMIPSPKNRHAPAIPVSAAAQRTRLLAKTR